MEFIYDHWLPILVGLNGVTLVAVFVHGWFQRGIGYTEGRAAAHRELRGGRP